MKSLIDPHSVDPLPPLFDRMAWAIEQVISSSRASARSLHALAKGSSLSPSHFQRVFTDHVGISPKRLAQRVQANRSLQSLAEGRSVLDTSLESEVSSPGRLHDLLVTCEAMSPGEIRAKGMGVTFLHGWVTSPIGLVWAMGNARGLHEVTLLRDEIDVQNALHRAQQRWPYATFEHHSGLAQAVVDAWFGRGSIVGSPPSPVQTFHLRWSGSNFQMKVWEALLRVPSGDVVSYQSLAEQVGHPKAVRAVGNAVGNNPIALIIPCHRVLRANGVLGGYRWGVERKEKLLSWEWETFNSQSIKRL